MVGKALSAGEVNELVKRALKDYGETLRKLA